MRRSDEFTQVLGKTSISGRSVTTPATRIIRIAEFRGPPEHHVVFRSELFVLSVLSIILQAPRTCHAFTAPLRSPGG